MSESKTQTEEANDTVEVSTEVLRTLVNAAEHVNSGESDSSDWNDSQTSLPAETAVEQARAVIKGDSEETVYLTDEKDELYGYAVYNTHEGCFVPLPEDLSNIRAPVTADHLTPNRSESILHAVAYEHQLDNTDHLRVVRVTLDNELDHKAIEHLEDKKQEV